MCDLWTGIVQTRSNVVITFSIGALALALRELCFRSHACQLSRQMRASFMNCEK